MSYSNLDIFTGTANPELAAEVCEVLGKKLSKADVGYFSDGEIKELNNYSTTQVVRELRNQQDFASNGLNELKSQLLTKAEVIHKRFSIVI